MKAGQPEPARRIAPPRRRHAGRLQPAGGRLKVEVTNLAANRIRWMDAQGMEWRVRRGIHFVRTGCRLRDTTRWPRRAWSGRRRTATPSDGAYWETVMLRFVGFVLMLAPAAWGWGREGHAITGAIAARYLTPEARAAVERLLEPGETLAGIGSWADEVRGARRETSTWHYINLPVDEPRGDWRPHCPESGCVIGIIPVMLDRLRDPALDRAAKAEALKFLVHFAADLHQPLHTASRGDRGGNSVDVVFRGRSTNLHSVWDTPLLLWMMEQDPALRARLERGASYWTRRRMQRGSVEDWAWETHSVSRDAVYRHLPEGAPATLGEDYARAVAPFAELQLLRGGVRLARLLNEALGQ